MLSDDIAAGGENCMLSPRLVRDDDASGTLVGPSENE